MPPEKLPIGGNLVPRHYAAPRLPTQLACPMTNNETPLAHMDRGDGRWRRFAVTRDGSVIALLFVVNLLLRMVLLGHPPDEFFFNLDELNLTFSCIDRFLGLPTTAAPWPSTPLQLLFVPIFGVDFLIHSVSHGQPFLDRLATYIADSYADPRHQVFILRATVGLLGSTAPPLFYLISRQLGIGKTNSALSASVLSVSPAFFQQSLMVAGDVLAMAGLLGAIAILMSGGEEKNRRGYLVGFIFAFAVSSKLTIASSLVLLGATALARYGRPAIGECLAALARFACGFGVGIFFWWPHLWIEPLRTFKAVLGNVNKIGAHADAVRLLGLLKESLGSGFLIFLCILILCLVYFLSKRRPLFAVLTLLVSFLLILIPLALRATAAYPRYFIPLEIPPLLALSLLFTRHPRMATAGLALLLVTTSYTTFAEQSRIRSGDDLRRAAEQLERIPSNVETYIPNEIALTYAIVLPAKTYARISLLAQENLFEHSALKVFLREHGVDDLAARVLINDFDEEEQANVARTSAAATSSTRLATNHVVDLYLLSEETSPRSAWTRLRMKEAVERLHGSGPVAILLPVDAPVPDELNAVRIWRGEHWTWYMSAVGRARSNRMAEQAAVGLQ